MNKTYLRGDMYYADLGRGIGSEQEGYRPVVIIQNNTGNKYSPTVIVAAISSKVDAKAKLPTHYLLKAESGLELLIHIGVDTVELGGKFYTAHVKDGDEVKKGQTLITFDMDAIKAAGYDVTTPLIVTNTDDYEEVKMLAEGTVNNGSEVLEVK